MSYNYEININNSKKKKSSHKYTCNNNEVDSKTYIFELIVINKMNENNIIRKIKRNNVGTLISCDDMILYNNIDKYILTVIDINNPNNPIIVKEQFNDMLTANIYLNDMIYLEIIPGSYNYIDINYHIL
jgi:hypothetical protein